MKKVLLVLLILVMCGCTQNNELENIDDLSIVVPAGAPSLAFYNELNNNKFATADAASIMPELKGENGSDIIVIDTANGIKALNAGANYKLAATITFGNFYLAATGNDDDGIMNDGDYIVVFSQGATPDLIFHYLYGNDYDSNIHYVSAVSDASACLIKGINISDEERKIDEEPYVDYVMIAEPALSVALSQNQNASVYANIQEEYANKSKNHSMIQASVFVSNNLSEKQVYAYLEKLETSINDLLKNPSIFVEATDGFADNEIKEIFGVPNKKLANKVLLDNTIGLGYQKAYDIKEDIDYFISLFGVEKTSEEIFIK